MANITLKSERQIQTEQLALIISQLGINDINPGSVIDVLTQASAQQDFQQFYRIAQILRLTNLKNLKGTDLDDKGFEFGLERRLATKTRGLIEILRPVGFEKVQLAFYSGLPSPTEGETTIFLANTNALLSTSGTLIIGRGTNNLEEVSYSVAPTFSGTHYTLALDSALVNNHSPFESVILKQGTDQVILSGTIVRVPSTSSAAEITFTLDNDATLLAGEDKISGVEVTASNPGATSNIGAFDINGTFAFSTPPFAGARAQNTAKFTSGTNRESDTDYRNRIQEAGDFLTKGVKNAIRSAIIGLVDPETAKRVISSKIVLPIDDAGPVKIYIDDGTGFEPSFDVVGYEIIRNSLTGGEQRLQLDNFPLAKAFVESASSEPFSILSSVDLTLNIGVIQEVISIGPTDFRQPNQGTAEEVCAVINNTSNLVEARTSQQGSKITITAKVDSNESLSISAGGANSIFNFPVETVDTLNLYKNDVKLNKDGITAFIDSEGITPYNLQSLGAYPHTLTMIVDGKSANTQTATINLVDVSNPLAVTAQEIADIINRDISGVVATSVNGGANVRIQSNIELSSSSKIEVTGGTANALIDFDTIEFTGVSRDYTLNRELGIVELTSPLVIGDLVTAGSPYTEARLKSTNPALYTPGNGSTLIVTFDGTETETVTFDATFASPQTADVVAAYLNDRNTGFVRGSAVVRTFGSSSFIEIYSNNLESGSIELDAASTAAPIFGFTTDVEFTNQEPNSAYKTNGNLATSFDLAPSDNLIIVVDGSTTYNVPMYQEVSVSADDSDTEFTSSDLIDLFPTLVDSLIDYNLVVESGTNVFTEDLESVSIPSPGNLRFTAASALPAGYLAGDVVEITGTQALINTGQFIITAVGANYVDVVRTGLEQLLPQGTITLKPRREIINFNSATGELELDASLIDAPAIGDDFKIIPSTVDNIVAYLNNLKMTSLSYSVNILKIEDDQFQLSSKNSGADGSIQVTGGLANSKFGFTTNISTSNPGYKYWTALTKLVHKTIYGDDTDVVAFPGVGAAGVIFQILAPTVLELFISLQLSLQEGISITSVENEVKSAVSGYINSLGVGEPVIIERIRAAVIAINGISDVSISSPVDNIAIADNELARISGTDINIG